MPEVQFLFIQGLPVAEHNLGACPWKMGTKHALAMVRLRETPGVRHVLN